MIKRVVKITGNDDWVVDTINDFISNELKENEYVIDIKYIDNGTRFKPNGGGFETVVMTFVHIGEKVNGLR